MSYYRRKKFRGYKPRTFTFEKINTDFRDPCGKCRIIRYNNKKRKEIF